MYNTYHYKNIESVLEDKISRGHVRHNVAPPPAPLIIPPTDFLAVAAETGISRSSSIKTASVLCKRHPDQNLATGRQVKRKFDSTNRAYGQLSRCIIIDPQLSPIDSAEYVITDIVQFVHFTCEIQSRPVSTLRHLKISGDQGQDSLKFSLQLLFDDSYILQDIPDEKSAAAVENIKEPGS